MYVNGVQDTRRTTLISAHMHYTTLDRKSIQHTTTITQKNHTQIPDKKRAHANIKKQTSEDRYPHFESFAVGAHTTTHIPRSQEGFHRETCLIVNHMRTDSLSQNSIVSLSQ